MLWEHGGGHLIWSEGREWVIRGGIPEEAISLTFWIWQEQGVKHGEETDVHPGERE